MQLLQVQIKGFNLEQLNYWLQMGNDSVNCFTKAYGYSHYSGCWKIEINTIIWISNHHLMFKEIYDQPILYNMMLKSFLLFRESTTLVNLLHITIRASSISYNNMS